MSSPLALGACSTLGDFEDRAGKVPAPDIFLSLRNSSYGMVSFGSQETRAPDKTFGLQCFRKWDRSWSPSQARVCLGPLHSSGFVNGSDGYFMLSRTSPFDLRWLLWLPWLLLDLLRPQLQTHLTVAVRFRAPRSLIKSQLALLSTSPFSTSWNPSVHIAMLMGTTQGPAPGSEE